MENQLKKRTQWERSISFALIILCLTPAFGQKIISGSVKDTFGESIIGANVYFEGTTRGTLTDFNGQFALDIKENDKTLIISSVGYEDQKVSIANKELIDIVMNVSVNKLKDVIVSASRYPIRKIEATTAATVIGREELQTKRPETIAEAINSTPGVYTEQNQTRTRGTIVMRGFPEREGFGFVYTGLLLDGLPLSATTARQQDFSFILDNNVDHIEVVRGSTSTLFGRSAAAGVVNVISKVGGEELSGSIGFTNYIPSYNHSELNYRTDFNIEGAILKNLRFSLGGFLLQDRGARNLGYPDKGKQIRGNIDLLLPATKSKLNITFGYNDHINQIQISQPIRMDNFELADGWNPEDSYYHEGYKTWQNPFLQNTPGTVNILKKNNELEEVNLDQQMRNGNFSEGYYIGFNGDIALPDGWKLVGKSRLQRNNFGFSTNIPILPFYSLDQATNKLANVNMYTFGKSSQTEALGEGRIQKNIVLGKTSHDLTMGLYGSLSTYDLQNFAWVHLRSLDPNSFEVGTFGLQFDPIQQRPVFVNSLAVSPSNSTFQGSSDDFDISVIAGFFGTESKIGQNLRVNTGIRVDQITMDLQGTFDADTLGVLDGINSVIVRPTEVHSDFSYSIGLNYKINRLSALYANYVRAFRLPDYSTYASVTASSLTETPTVEENEIIKNLELGYRNTFGDIDIDFALFRTNIKNRLSVVFQGEDVTSSIPIGNNSIMGGELTATYKPNQIKGVKIRGSLTIQNSRIDKSKIAESNLDPNLDTYGNPIELVGTSFNPFTNQTTQNYNIDVSGNQLPRVPQVLSSVITNYEHSKFGAGLTYNFRGKRYIDATNIYQLPAYSLLDFSAYYKYSLNKGSLKLGAGIKNLLNSNAVMRIFYLSDTGDALLQKQLNPSDEGRIGNGQTVVPRRIIVNLSYNF